MKVDAGIVTACRSCGREGTELEVVSAHRTTEGIVRYVRCTCRALQVRLESGLDGSHQVLAGAQPVPAVDAA